MGALNFEHQLADEELRVRRLVDGRSGAWVVLETGVLTARRLGLDEGHGLLELTTKWGERSVITLDLRQDPPHRV